MCWSVWCTARKCLFNFIEVSRRVATINRVPKEGDGRRWRESALCGIEFEAQLVHPSRCMRCWLRVDHELSMTLSQG